MRNRILGIYGIYAAFGLMGMMAEPDPGRALVEKLIPKRKPLVLDNYNHIGEIPKGCKITREVIYAFKDDHTLTIEVDILHGTEKARRKKYIKIEHEIETYIRNTSLQEIIASGRFSIK